MLKKCAITGSFDPFSNGHMYLVKKAKKYFDLVYILILVNENKLSFFKDQEKFEMITKLYKDDKKVIVNIYKGIGADYMRKNSIDTIIRGFRNPIDLNYENTISKFNKEYEGIDTLLLATKDEIKDVSSTKIRELINKGKFNQLTKYLPAKIIEYIKEINPL